MALSEADARARAEAEVVGYCGWHIAPSRTDELVIDSNGADVLMLPTLRMTALVELSVDDELVDLTTVEWSEAGFIRRDAAWPTKLRGVSVEFTHGYDTMPLDVTAVIDRLTARALDAQSMGSLVQVGQVRVATDSEGVPFGAQLTELDRHVLNRYKLPPRP